MSDVEKEKLDEELNEENAAQAQVDAQPASESTVPVEATDGQLDDASEKKTKKKMSKKKKKILIIVLSVVFALIVLVVVAGLIVLHNYCETKDYTVVGTTEEVTLVAHRGMRSVAPENTAAAFNEAGRHGYWGAECDVYRTKDGVWVVSHDSNTYRMMDKTAWIEKKTYDELMEMKVDNGVNIDSYSDLRICSLEDYLSLCKTYQMTPVIELKGTKNTEHYIEIVNLLDEYYLEPIYISFHIENLEKMRQLTQAQMYFLTQEISDDDIEQASKIGKCGIDFNGNKEKNFEGDTLKKCVNSGLKLGAWTINDLDTMQKLVDNGVTLITTDCIEYENGVKTLPSDETEEAF